MATPRGSRSMQQGAPSREKPSSLQSASCCTTHAAVVFLFSLTHLPPHLDDSSPQARFQAHSARASFSAVEQGVVGGGPWITRAALVQLSKLHPLKTVSGPPGPQPLQEAHDAAGRPPPAGCCTLNLLDARVIGSVCTSLHVASKGESVFPGSPPKLLLLCHVPRHVSRLT